MYIYPKHTGPTRPETTTQTGDVSETAAVKPIAPAPSGAERSDKVEISDAGRQQQCSHRDRDHGRPRRFRCAAHAASNRP